MGRKRSGAYNRNRGQRAEQKVVNELKALGFTGVVTSRSESKTTDDNKVDIKCKNPRCITSIEQELTHCFVLADKEKEIYRCKYCEEAYVRK